MSSWLRFLVVVSLLALYVAGCLAPAVWKTTGPSYGFLYPGFLVLIGGWLPEAHGPAPWATTLPWSANLLFFVGLVALALRYYRVALLFGVAASLVAGTTWWAPAGTWAILLGYFLWHAALLGLALGSAFCYLATGATAGPKRRVFFTVAALSVTPLVAAAALLAHQVYRSHQTDERAAAVTPDNHARITPGMSRAEVHEILGVGPGDYRTDKSYRFPYDFKHTGLSLDIGRKEFTFSRHGTEWHGSQGQALANVTLEVWLVYGAAALVMYDGQGRVLEKHWYQGF
jgi:hypothetical protein